jgi:uncharacterized membrane protein HdeD (DUF308 family)
MDPSNDNNRFIGATFQSHWLLFGLVGALLLLAGLVAIIVPTISSIAPSELLGLVLAFVGIIQSHSRERCWAKSCSPGTLRWACWRP